MSKDEAIKILLDLNYYNLYKSDISKTCAADTFSSRDELSKIHDIFKKENIWLFIKDSGDISFNLCPKKSNGLSKFTPLFLVKITDLIILNRKNKLNKVN